MSDHALEHIRKHIGVYVAVFVALCVFTIITVGLAGLHFSRPIAVALGMLVAVVKGGLVALFFMHLSNERKFIYGSLLLTVVFFFTMLLLPLFSMLGSSRSAEHLYAVAPAAAGDAAHGDGTAHAASAGGTGAAPAHGAAQGADGSAAVAAAEVIPAGPLGPKAGAAPSATIRGRVSLRGKPPVMKPLSVSGDPVCAKAHATPPVAEAVVLAGENGLADVFVWVSKGISGKFPVPDSPARIDQHGCIYSPHVLGLRVGQELEFVNSDETTHNVHTLPKGGTKEFNRAMIKGQAPMRTKFTKAEALPAKVKCDVHPWMSAWVGVVDHPYFAVSNREDARFEVTEKIPAGTYVVTAWHELYGKQDQVVTVEEGETKEIEFTFGK